MERIVCPFLGERQSELWLERKKGNKIHCMRYWAEPAEGAVLISHGFTESAEKYEETIYYFLKKGFHVYCMEHCGHGYSYRLTDDLSLVHVDRYERYVEDLLFVARKAKEENHNLPLFLYGHSMGGGIGAAAAARGAAYFDKLILSAPMMRPQTKPVPWKLAQVIAGIACLLGKEKEYVKGQRPYEGTERFEDSAAVSEARFAYYQRKRNEEPLYQTNAPSYGWLRNTGRLNRYLQKEGWKKITAPVLLFQAEQDAFVSLREQERFAKKLGGRGEVQLIKVPGTKHEICRADDAALAFYWENVFAFLERSSSSALHPSRISS